MCSLPPCTQYPVGGLVTSRMLAEKFAEGGMEFFNTCVALSYSLGWKLAVNASDGHASVCSSVSDLQYSLVAACGVCSTPD